MADLSTLEFWWAWSQLFAGLLLIIRDFIFIAGSVPGAALDWAGAHVFAHLRGLREFISLRFAMISIDPPDFQKEVSFDLFVRLSAEFVLLRRFSQKFIVNHVCLIPIQAQVNLIVISIFTIWY